MAIEAIEAEAVDIVLTLTIVRGESVGVTVWLVCNLWMGDLGWIDCKKFCRKEKLK